MANRWTKEEEDFYRNQLREFYVLKNKTIAEIGEALGFAPSTIYDRLIRLGINPQPEKKIHYLGRRLDVIIPQCRSEKLAEFFGIMMGDGKLSHFQVAVTLGNKEVSYANYVADLMANIFAGKPKIISNSARGYRVVYLGSTLISNWLKSEGFVYNKVLSQVDVPSWIFSRTSYMKRFARGFFDTDGSVYKLKYGIQLSFTNYSQPLLASLQYMLGRLGYRVSRISGPRFYITKKQDVWRFFNEIDPHNKRHVRRFSSFQ